MWIRFMETIKTYLNLLVLLNRRYVQRKAIGKVEHPDEQERRLCLNWLPKNVERVEAWQLEVEVEAQQLSVDIVYRIIPAISF